MIRTILTALALTGALVIALTPAPALACRPHLAIDTAREIAAIRQALPKATLTAAERGKVRLVIALSRKGNDARDAAGFEQALAEAMTLLGLPRIYRPSACLVIKPAATS